ncbi:hypothetical protein BBJ28_00009323 [Nothophytophthora sp. Chile5]|nr:hypothetical protein BBJ28_00009323 [Nothophytophthora sp. Chile5]
MAACFLNAPDPNVFSCTTKAEWGLVIEMEVITNFMSDLALVEFQRASILPSFLLVFRNMAEGELAGTEFNCLTLKTPDKTATDSNQFREPVEPTSFSAAGKVCLARCTRQLETRFPAMSKSMIMTLLLDPRTKNIAASIADNMGGASPFASTHADRLVIAAREKLVKDHIEAFKMMQPRDSPSSSPESKAVGNYAAPATKRACSNKSFLFGAPIPSASKRTQHDSYVLEEADVVVRRWMDLEVDWVKVALRQQLRAPAAATPVTAVQVAAAKKVKDKTEEDLRKEMTINNRDGDVWNLLELYWHVDILRWFREEGERMFPSIALLARYRLGKVSSSAFQERVFSTASVVMGPLRTTTENSRAEKQLLLRHNRDMLGGLMRKGFEWHQMRKRIRNSQNI